MTWKIKKDFRFEAAHRLPHHEGKCARLHGHSWKGTLVCEGKKLVETGSQKGMLLDYQILKEAILPLLENYLDHFYLNDSLPLENPTSEKIAKWIYDQLHKKLPLLTSVVIEETCTARCEYRE